MPAPLAVNFTNLDMEGIAALLDGQSPAALFGRDVHVVAALHSTGWGQSTSDEAVLIVTEENDRYFWTGFLYTNGRFADANLGAVAAPWA
ncbi:MAG: hypothetical protein HC804_06035 [Anaerolineae bacterium]|nr:hypothetical protein [Anaerolineae bacterium]